MNKKRLASPLVLLLVMLPCLAGLFLVLRQPWLMENPSYVYLNGTLRHFIRPGGGQGPTRPNTLPFALTDGQRYPVPLVPESAINLLVIGPDQSGANWDTLLVASLDEDGGILRLVNIPRDLYVSYGPEVLDRLGKASPKTLASVPARKINAAHLIGQRIGYRTKAGRFGSPDLDFTADLIQELFGIRVDDCLIIQPSGFRDIVDHFGGVQIEVPYRMRYRDPLQKLEIDLKPGMQLLNGAQAEGFVRFRQGVDDRGKAVSIGDVERKKNQTAFARAFVEQHATVSNLGRGVRLIESLDGYFQSTLGTPDRYAAYTGLGLSMLEKGLVLENPAIACEDFKHKGIYFLRFADPADTP